MTYIHTVSTGFCTFRL